MPDAKATGAGRGNKSYPASEGLAILVGTRVREAREAKALTQTEAAANLGCHVRTLWGIEGGDLPRLGLLERIATVYDKPIWWFFYEQPPPGQGERDPFRDRWRGAGGVRRREPGAKHDQRVRARLEQQEEP